ncbi:MAG: TonB-dependent receptor [Fibrobacterales bacterium]
MFSLCTSGFALPSDTIIVSEKLPTASTLYKNQSTVIINEAEWLGKENNLANILARQTAIQTRQFGGVGGVQSVTIRGQSGSRVVVCIDDIPINRASGSTVDLGKIDLSLYERIEIYKSFIPAKFGVSSVGGVINLISKKKMKESVRADLSLGSFQTFHNTVSYNQKIGVGFNSQSIVSVIHSDNDFKFLNRNGTTYNTTDDSVMQKSNDGYTSASGIEVITGKVLKGELFIKVEADYNSKELSGNEYKVTNRSTISSMSGSVFGQYKKRWNIRTYPEMVLGSKNSIGSIKHFIFKEDYPLYVNQDTESQRVSYSWKPFVSFRILPSEQWLLYHKLAYEHELLKPQHLIGDTIDQAFMASRQAVKNSTEITFYPIESIKVHGRCLADLMWDKRELKQEELDWHLGYSGGLHYTMLSNNSNTMVLFGVVGKNYRIASLEERYGTKNGILANDTLKSETSFEWELGFRFERKKLQTEITYFSKEVNDWIGRKYSSGIMKYINEDKTFTNGIEFSLKTFLSKNIFTSSLFTIQGSEVLSNKSSTRNNLLPYVPFITFDNTFEYTYKSVTLGYDYGYQSSMFRDLSNSWKTKPGSQHDVYLKMKLAKNANLTAGVYDITSSYSANESVNDAYPSPGQNFKIHITINK